jgi:hypothetical protein
MKTLSALGAAAAIALGAACQRQAPVAATSPVAASETPCWWTVYRSELPVDTVAVHLVNAFSALGLTDATWVRQGDTAWAHAGPTRLASRFGGTFAARAVAFQRGDSTLYRYFVTAAPPPGGWRHGYDSVTVTGGHISVIPASSYLGLCASIASTAQNGGKAPKQPNGEETLAVWSSRPASGAAAATAAPGAVAAPGRAVEVPSVPLRPLRPANADSIVLERTPCFGTCPVYRVRIARSGEVLYQSRAPRDTTRTLTSIPREDADPLFERADILRFDALPDTIARVPVYCRDPATDFPTATTTIFVGSASKHVVDYQGCDWAPVGLRRLEAMIDSVAGTERLMKAFVVPRSH